MVGREAPPARTLSGCILRHGHVVRISLSIRGTTGGWERWVRARGMPCVHRMGTHTHTDERGARAQRGGRVCQRGCLVQQRRWWCCSGVREGAREEGIAAAVCWPVVSAWWMVGDRLKCGVEGLSRRAKGFLVGMRTRRKRRWNVTATPWALCGGGERTEGCVRDAIGCSCGVPLMLCRGAASPRVFAHLA